LYVSKTGGFALDYPEGWTVKETVVGDRGTEILFVSKSDLAEAATLPLGETRLTATIYQWDPKNNLPAYVDHWKTAWESSGFTILEEQALTLELGLSAERPNPGSAGDLSHRRVERSISRPRRRRRFGTCETDCAARETN
jgi:hypothetical protein